MSITLSHARREFEILLKAYPDPGNPPIVKEFMPEMLSLIEKFGRSGQSGGSVHITAAVLCSTIKSLCLQEPISPIMGTDDEWVDVTEISAGRILFQNNRCSAVFRDGKDGVPHFIDAIVFKYADENGQFTSNSGVLKKDGSRVGSQQYVRLPFTPKKFYIDVIEVDGETHVKDERQLKKVFKYYDEKK